MATFTRTDTSILGRWWWTVDRWMLMSFLILMVLGALLSLAASPAVAIHHSLESYYFVKRHLLFLIPSLFIMVAVSLMSPKNIVKFCVFMFVGGMILLLVTPFIGFEIKGAKRWINMGLLSIQPSEFVKPAFVVLTAWILSKGVSNPKFPKYTCAILLYASFVGLLVIQPDLGMTVLVTAVWGGQLFLAGLPALWIISSLIAGAGGLVGAYLLLPHVTKRIDRFFEPGDRYTDQYQVTQSLEAFTNGGFLGRGPGEGIVKKNLPDAHGDFIFAVAGEEFGLIVCLIILALFAFVVLRSIKRLSYDRNIYILLAGVGLVMEFGFQAIINVSSALHLIPTKGMTLPFISYGGSSMLAIAVAMGMLLGFTRKRMEVGGDS